MNKQRDYKPIPSLPPSRAKFCLRREDYADAYRL